MTHPNDRMTTAQPHDHFDGYGITFFLLFLVFMVLAVAGQLLVLDWRSWLPGAEGYNGHFGRREVFCLYRYFSIEFKKGNYYVAHVACDRSPARQ